MFTSLIGAIAFALALSHAHVAVPAHSVTAHVGATDTNGSGPPIVP